MMMIYLLKRNILILINRLFDLGADINIQDEYGLDALMIATGHEALDEFWYKYFGGGLGNEEPNPYYVELLLENLKRTRQRYEFTNAAQNGEDFGDDEYTLEESLDRYGRKNNNNQQAYRETLELIREYRLELSKPVKSANFRKVRKSPSKSKSRSNSRSRSSGASERW